MDKEKELYAAQPVMSHEVNEEQLPPMLRDFSTVLVAAGVKPSLDLLDYLGGVAQHHSEAYAQKKYQEGELRALNEVLLLEEDLSGHDQLSPEDYISGDKVRELKSQLERKEQ